MAMDTRTSITLAIVLLILAPVGLAAQETTMYSANPLRLDLRVLGHPPLDVIPPGESAITSLVVGADGNLYGGTSGKRAHLFVLDPKWGHVFPLGHLPGQESIFHSMAAAPDGSIYIGTSLLNQGRIDERGKDVLQRYKGYAGGHIFRFEPAKELQDRKRMTTPDPSRSLPFAADLGVPVAGESVVSLIYGNGALYGVTFPSGHFFVMDPATGKAVDKGPVCGAPLNEEPFRSIPRALVLDAKGRVWGTGDYGALIDYSPGTGTLTQHRDRRVPAEMGREYKAIVDALVLNRDGTIYGGTSDGFIFRFDPEAMTIQNLGKPIWQQRIRGLAFSQDGDLWGVGGEPGESARVFVYRTRAGSFESGGMLHVNRTPYYAWLAYEAESMIAGPDGTLFIGETGRLAHLYLLYPWK
jgi:outer membrane protein assembly factor BamB